MGCCGTGSSDGPHSVLRHVPADRMLFITRPNGAPYKAKSFGRWFKERCKEAGLPHCSPHGLRNGQAPQIAEEGGTELEVMSFLVHATPAEGATYTKRAGRTKLAGSRGETGT